MDGLPSDFKNRINDLHGYKGQKWLNELPSRICTIERRWQLKASTPFNSLSYNYVAPVVTQNGNKAVLKLSFQGSALQQEAESLRFFNGHGATKLLKFSAKYGALLIERVLPGTNIKQINESEAVEAFVSIIKKLHRPLHDKPDFPTVQDWGRSFKRLRDKFNGGSGPLPSNLIGDGQTLFEDLSNTMTTSVLLPGDLHHENILAGTRELWLAIDPKGVIGEPEYEIGAFLRNPMSKLVYEENLIGLLKDRIEMISEMTGYDKKRIGQWGFAQAVLSANWSFEDHQSGWNNAIEIARTIKKVINYT